ncbi:hypothetical protein GCM10009530_57120 [Microbispora corallina]|uniref:Uncharacterized protein n=1 Tax=Microbispora corallina TaxID=83302 RepID=A0ABQ4G3L5_9ACTN|nr:hypothetical protein Mco01_46570 [Microbispora corallina]
MVIGAAPAEDPPEAEVPPLSPEPLQAAVTPSASVATAAIASILPRRALSIIPDPSQVVSRISWEVHPRPVPDFTARDRWVFNVRGHCWERSHEGSSMSNAGVNMLKPNCYSGGG